MGMFGFIKDSLGAHNGTVNNAGPKREPNAETEKQDL
jgi:hypothetical protein